MDFTKPLSEAAVINIEPGREPSAIKRPATSSNPTLRSEEQGVIRNKTKKCRRSNNDPVPPAAVSNGSSTEDDSSSAEHPFPYLLRCQRSRGDQPSIRLLWHSPWPHVPLASEAALVPVLMHWKDTEGGMAKRLPHWRLQKIKKACHEHRVPLASALSLRRHHIRNLHPNKSLERLGLGRERQVRESARLFERCVQDFLDQNRVQYWNEEYQGEHNGQAQKEHDARVKAKGRGRPAPPTPDFILKEEILVLKYSDTKQGRRRILEEKRVGWIEAKMFYGASTIPLNQRSAVGNLLATAEKYVRYFGPGAIVFMHGCGDRLAVQLSQAGVIVLDCHSRDTVSLRLVHDHQRTWCANDNGDILP